MNKIRTVMSLAAIVVLIGSCTKTETKISTGAKNGTLLAGASGQSKSWKLVTISQSVNGGTAVPASNIPTCESDNIYKFSNNAAQDYQNGEGAATCTPSDPTAIETGTWAFTDDGNTLLIEGTTAVTNNEVNSIDHYLLAYFIFTQVGPLKIIEINDSLLTFTYTFTYQGNKYLYRVALAKI